MKKLCIFTLYADKGASSQYRTYIYKKELEKQFYVQWFYFWNNTYITKYIRNKKKYFVPILFQFMIAAIARWIQITFIATRADVVYIQKGMIPKVRKTYLKRLKKKGIRIIFDVDDAIYLDQRNNSDDIARFSDCVICGNETLKEHYIKMNPNCLVLPTIDNTHQYEKYWSDTFNHKAIGWIGSKATIANLKLVVEPLNNIIERHPEISFYIISDDAMDYGIKIKNCHFIKWDKEKYIHDLSQLTIGIMPLEDNEYNKGKCGFKLIQYINMKKPMIGTPVGVNRKIIAGNGMSAKSASDWEKSMESLLYDKEIYDKCVMHIEKDLLETYSFDGNTRKMIDILSAD